MKVYSGLHEITLKEAKGPVTDGCLVVEGGGFRGVYGVGVMDALMDYGVNIRCLVGTSAGALCGVSYISRQRGRSAIANLGKRHDSNYVGAKAIARSHSLIRLEYLFDEFEEDYPLDKEAFFDPDRRFVAVVTNCLTGKPMYLEAANCGDMASAIKASGTLPFISPMMDVEGTPCFDGGCSCKIAYQWALDQEYEKIVVLKTRERGFRKEVSDKRPASKLYRHYPEFAEASDNSSYNYNKQCDEIEKLEAEGRIFVIAPSETVDVDRIEGDMEKLGWLYLLGYYDALTHIMELRDYLGMEALKPSDLP